MIRKETSLIAAAEEEDRCAKQTKGNRARLWNGFKSKSHSMIPINSSIANLVLKDARVANVRGYPTKPNIGHD